MAAERERARDAAKLIETLTDENKLLNRRLERERQVRYQAEEIAERGLRDLYQRQRELEFLSTITIMANQAGAVREVLASAVGYICRFAGWPAGHAFLISGDGTDRRMRPTGVWYHHSSLDLSALKSDTEKLVFARGQGLPGQVWESGAPQWFADLKTCENFLRRESALRSGMRVAFSAPLLVRNEVVGALEFFGHEPMPEDAALLGLTAKAGTQLGRAIERENNEALLAGVAVDNARLYEQSRTRLAWIEATRDIATDLLGGDEPDRVFGLIADQALRLTDADAVLVVVPSDTEVASDAEGEMVVVAAAGSAAANPNGPPATVPGKMLGADYAACTPRLLAEIEGAALIPDAGPAMVLPLRTAETLAGVVVVVRRRGAAQFGDNQLDMMAAFADQAALAWQLANSRRQMRELDVIADRERIARDLHDSVIQRLFAVGLSLQGTIPRANTSEVQTRLSDTVDELQNVIQEIRTTIFDLHGGTTGSTRLRQRISEAIAAFAGAGPRTAVQFVGPLSVVEPALADHAEAVVREAVSNAVRHSGAGTVTVTVRVENDFRVEVVDDGCGMPADVTPSGLSNLRARADEVGGELAVSAAPGGGTAVRWIAPLP